MDTAAIIMAIATLVAALASAVVSVYNATKVRRIEAGQEVIRKDVNSNMQAALAEIKELRAKLVAANKKTKP